LLRDFRGQPQFVVLGWILNDQRLHI
jgi:hypothetical protein